MFRSIFKFLYQSFIFTDVKHYIKCWEELSLNRNFWLHKFLISLQLNVSGDKDTGTQKLEFVANNQFLCDCGGYLSDPFIGCHVWQIKNPFNLHLRNNKKDIVVFLSHNYPSCTASRRLQAYARKSQREFSKSLLWN